jgi:O-antigen/teichoic acid export membrane protein
MKAQAEAVILAPPPTGEESGRTARTALVRNVGVDMVARVGYLVTRVFIPPFVLSRIGLEAYSLWAALFIVISYAGATTVGVSSVYVKYVADYASRGETHKANSLLSTGFVTIGAVAAVCFCAVALGLHNVLSWLEVPPRLQPDARLAVLLLSATFLTDFAMSFFRESLSGVQKVAEVQLVWVVSYLVETVLIFYLVGTGHGIDGLAEAFAARILISIVLYGLLAYRVLPWLRISLRLCSAEALKQLINFGGTVQIVALLSIALNTIERAIAIPLVGLSAVGLLDISDKLPGMAAIIPTALSTSLFPAAAYIHGGYAGTIGGREEVLNLYLKGTRYMNLLASSMAGFMVVSSLPLMTVWLGKVYPGTAFLMAIFALQQNFHVMTGPGTAILKGIGRPRDEFFYSIPNIAAVLVTIPLSRLVLGHWSTVGLGSAVVVATVISAVAFILYANRILKVPQRRFLREAVIPGVLPYLVGLAFAWPVSLANHTGRWSGAVIIATVATMYALSLAFLMDRTVLATDERQWLRAAISRRTNFLFRKMSGVEVA